MVNKSYLSIKLMLLGAWDSQVLPGCGCGCEKTSLTRAAESGINSR